MIVSANNKLALAALKNAPLILFAIVLVVFAGLSPKFIEPRNLLNILVQSSSIAIVAAGMTFVLLSAGIDLSVGSIMFVAAVVAGKIMLAGQSLSLAFAAILFIGLLYGAVNAFFITRLKVIAFIVTLATLYVGRGFGLLLSETRAMNLPEELLQVGAARVFGIPMPVLMFGAVFLAGHITLTMTAFGRQLYAVGNDATAARKAGINVARVLLIVYLISGFCAALGGLISVAQLGAVSPTFGNQREFAAIAAAVIGGTSLFGGRGQLIPGTMLGAILIQTIENGLVIVNADPYLYPLIMGAIIFLAVLIDSFRHAQLLKLGRSRIRVEEVSV
ncbi:MAG TPA: ABC transporter permease [Pyrinomonadaceae bacterium]|nr:ABC transporter permease [Pyrinomonadaceae bacterium]